MQNLFFCFVALTFVQFSYAEKMNFWSSQKKGANFFNYQESLERFTEAKKAGVDYIRLAPNKWLNGRTHAQRGDFLIGRASDYEGIIEKDFQRLLEVLNYAKKAEVKVVLTMLSLPKRRWTQHNGDLGQERKIWKSFNAQKDAIRFWKEIATRLKNHPTVVGYNIINEPSAEKVSPKYNEIFNGNSYQRYAEKVEGSPRDLNLFYAKMIEAIRSVDKNTPVILDSGHWANAHAFAGLKKQSDKKVLYSFHMYDPYPFTLGKNGGDYRYPGEIPLTESLSKKKWNKKTIREFLSPVLEWMKANKVSAESILVGEFGVRRDRVGAVTYLKDVMNIFDSLGFHWAFYSFREDNWDKLDYELGEGKNAPKGYYWRLEKGDPFPGKRAYKKNSLFDEILLGLAR